MELRDKIDQLTKELEKLKEHYLNNEKPENKKDREFFIFVKEQTTPVYQLIQDWEVEATAFVKQRKVRVHPQQVVSTSENLELLLMHSYYIDVKKKRYMELYKSIHYVFDLLLNDLESD
ncbi:DUF1798 family protein [Aquibacillus halophilus]|uniref:DUF1798 family protein n=1 Tax=Aquibacillus halophilus TaxID=930132 RepID=A0A6A8D9L1_9BACI|nr:DUF1798 family protein [Aquibacillus halophilus]MRH42443.1 DUF1798 family protein [Aquibacillus halophilus]